MLARTAGEMRREQAPGVDARGHNAKLGRLSAPDVLHVYLLPLPSELVPPVEADRVDVLVL